MNNNISFIVITSCMMTLLYVGFILDVDFVKNLAVFSFWCISVLNLCAFLMLMCLDDKDTIKIGRNNKRGKVRKFIVTALTIFYALFFASVGYFVLAFCVLTFNSLASLAINRANDLASKYEAVL